MTANHWLNKTHVGDCRELLCRMAAAGVRVQTCVTSPPYFGLRDYGHAGQIGLEATPDEYVATLVDVFREVRRVLRDDGTVWLNLGDSYAATTKGSSGKGEKQITNAGTLLVDRSWRVPDGLKPKDLLGIPWAVAKALQSPYYTGRIKAETDRAWLAGFLDGEGTISYVERDRGPDHSPTHDVRVFVTNCDDAPLRYFASMTAGHVYQHDGERENRYGSRPCFRWQMGTHDGALLLRELFPYLRTKRKQAALVWTLFNTLRHQNGHARTPSDVIEKRRAIAAMVRGLNAGQSVDLPDWIKEPPSATEPGYYLRSDIIWHKPNPMPESVTDRPTKAHEYLFLLAKSERYYYDAAAIAEPHARDWSGGKSGGTLGPNGKKRMTPAKGDPNYRGGSSQWERDAYPEPRAEGRNRRSVWTVATQPFSGAHFATFPRALIEPCILAGSRPGDTVLDPFMGSGTTGQVATDLGRNFIGVELNPKYVELHEMRRTTTGMPI